jgi:hypothetical protein
MAAPSLTALETAFVQGANIFRKNVLGWDLRGKGIQVRTNVVAPQALTKLSAVGAPRPYRTQDDFGTGPDFSDRTLTAYQSKWDYEFDPENFRNTYLATLPDAPFEAAAVDQVSKTYLDTITRLTLWAGVRNGAGTGAADLCDGWGTIIAAEITATNLTPVVTGAIASTDAVTKVETLAEGVPLWMREMGFVVLCSYNVFDKYKKHYRTLNGFGFEKGENQEYNLDGINAVLRPVAFMGTSQRLVATLPNNLVFGTNVEAVETFPTPHLNIMKIRHMMPVGCQIQDLEALVVNDQA